jgi:RimJ/RimL family protein N-acetyltransferase
MAAQLAYEDADMPQPASAQAQAPALAPAYQPFSSLPLFDALPAPAACASPKLADAGAAAIVCYWQSCLANGGMDPDQPVYLLDLAPRDGQTAWLLMNALASRLSAQGLLLPLCYLACYEDAASAAHHAGHPYFSDWIEAGKLDFAHWNAAHDALHLQHQKIVLHHTVNPLAILALGYFQRQPSELFCMHNGSLMQGSAAAEAASPIDAAADQANDADDANEAAVIFQLKYQWQAVEPTLPVLAEPLLAHYRYHCNGSALQLPLAACATLDRLNRFAHGRTLLLAADHGASNAQQIRLGACNPPASWCAGDLAPPVNFHALSLHQQQHGAWIWQQQLDEDGIVLHAAWRDDAQPVRQQDFRALCDRLAEAHPDDIGRLAAARHDPADTLTLLRLSHDDPQLLKHHIIALLDAPLAFSASVRREWQAALERTWCNFLPPLHNDGFYYQVGLLAAQLGHFGLAKDCFRQGLSWYGDDATDLYLLAWCESASGGVADAIALLAQALALDPAHAHSLALHATLTERMALWDSHPWYLPQHASAAALRLEPLGQEHAPALLYQYRDRQISVMTCLPEMDTIAQAQDWISEEQQNTRRASFAVLHACWGLVGVVSMHCSGDAGYFYFWIGSDFQEQGLGRQAAQILFPMMAEHGVTQVFTSAYDDNLRSIRALSKLGFTQLPLRALAPDDWLNFFHLSVHAESKEPPDAAAARRAALSALCCAIGSPLAF